MTRLCVRTGRWKPRAALALAGLAGLVTVTGCSSAAPVAKAAAVAGRCGNGDVTVAISGYAGHGAVNGTMIFTGKSAKTCTLLGNPQLMADTSGGNITGLPMSSATTGSSKAVSIGSKKSAIATFRWQTTPPALSKACPSLTRFSVMPPALTDVIMVPVPAALKGSMVCTTPTFGPVRNR